MRKAQGQDDLNWLKLLLFVSLVLVTVWLNVTHREVVDVLPTNQVEIES